MFIEDDIRKLMLDPALDGTHSLAAMVESVERQKARQRAHLPEPRGTLTAD